MSYNSTQVDSFIQDQMYLSAYGYVMVATSALFFYDTCLTLAQEVQFIWKTAFRAMSIFYVMARIFMSFYQILLLVDHFLPLSAKGLSVVFAAIYTLDVVGGISTECILLARAYAVMHSRRYLFSSLGMVLLSRVAFVVILWVASIRCESCYVSNYQKLFWIALLVVNGLTLLFVAMIFGITVYHTWCTIRLTRSRLDTTSRPSLTLLMFQQDVFRFFIISCLVLVTTITSKVDKSQLGSLMTFIEKPLSVILVLRFFLDLRERNARLSDTSSRVRDLGTVSTFKAVTRGISNAIIEDFGDPGHEASFVSRATSRGLPTGSVGGQMPHPITNQIGTDNAVPICPVTSEKGTGDMSPMISNCASHSSPSFLQINSAGLP